MTISIYHFTFEDEYELSNFQRHQEGSYSRGGPAAIYYHPTKKHIAILIYSPLHELGLEPSQYGNFMRGLPNAKFAKSELGDFQLACRGSLSHGFKDSELCDFTYCAGYWETNVPADFQAALINATRAMYGVNFLFAADSVPLAAGATPDMSL